MTAEKYDETMPRIEESGEFRLVRPRDEVRRIEAEAEGTEYEETEAEPSDAGVTIP